MARIYEHMHRGLTAPQVGILQRRLGIADDNIFGGGTQAAVVDAKTKLGLVPDGIADRLLCQALDIWSETVRGIDISHHQGRIDFSQLLSSRIPTPEGPVPVSFCLARASMGAYADNSKTAPLHDGRWEQYAPNLKRFRWRSAYHFAYGTYSAREEVDCFMKAVFPYIYGLNMPLVIDVEGSPGEHGFKLTGRHGLGWLTAFKAELLKRLPVEFVKRFPEPLMLYSSDRIIRLYGLEGIERIIPFLHDADYSEQDDNTGPYANWTIRQYTSKGVLGGIDLDRPEGKRNTVDLNVLALDSALGLHMLAQEAA